MQITEIKNAVAKHNGAWFCETEMKIYCSNSSTLLELVKELKISEEDYCDTPIDHVIYLKGIKYWFLDIVDSEDGYIYTNLLYNNYDDFACAKELINKFDFAWYHQDEEENNQLDFVFNTGSYYEDLISYLEQKELLGEAIVYEKIMIR